MARLLAQTLTLARPSPSAVSLRGLATKIEVIEIDLAEEDASAGPAGSPSVEVVGIQRLEEVIHGVMVRRATPDWLPFVPGGSFWVPPMRRPHGAAELIGRIAAAGEVEETEHVGGLAFEAEAYMPMPMTEAEPAFMHMAGVEAYLPMTEEEELSLSTARGWPSAAYFVEGKSPHLKKKSRRDPAQTDDEES